MDRGVSVELRLPLSLCRRLARSAGRRTETASFAWHSALIYCAKIVIVTKLMNAAENKRLINWCMVHKKDEHVINTENAK